MLVAKLESLPNRSTGIIIDTAEPAEATNSPRWGMPALDARLVRRLRALRTSVMVICAAAGLAGSTRTDYGKRSKNTSECDLAQWSLPYLSGYAQKRDIFAENLLRPH